MASDDIPRQPGPPDPERDFDWARAEAEVTASAEVNTGPGPASEHGPATRRDGVQDSSFSVALDDTPEPGPYLAPPMPPGSRGEETRVPILPTWARSRAAFRAQLRHVVGRWVHRAGYHAVRSPKYALLGGWYAGLGVFRLAGRQLRWWWLSEQEALRQAAATANDADTWHKLHREARHTRRWRAFVLAGEAACTGLGITLLLLLAPWWVIGAVLAVVVPVLAHVGRGSARPIVTPAVITPRFRMLTYDVVQRAYYAAKLGDPDKPGQQVQFAHPGMSRDGDGSRVVVDLPYGKGFDDAVKARGAIASGLDVAVSQVFLSRDPSSHRRHVLWVADRDPLAIPAGRTPLLACKETDIWKPATVGLNERGERVALEMMWNSILVGALPRNGKTFFARLLALYAALDPYVKLTVFDGKGSPDWRKFALVADRCSFGLAMTRDGDPVDVVLDALRELKADVQDRYQRLSELPVDVCPEGKLTRDIARNPKYRMPVRLVVIDEFQEYFDLGDASKEIASLLVFLVKVAPAAGVIVLDATQKPTGIGSGQIAEQFKSFRDNHAVRFALRTGSYNVSDLVLGAGAYSEGYDSSTLLPQYKGVGILRGASDATPTVRSHLADAADAERILRAARALRERAGTLSGMAAGEDLSRTLRDMLADAGGMFGAGENFLPWKEIAARLADRMPDDYADATGDAVSSILRGLGVPSVNGKYNSQTLKGARLSDIGAAIERREPGSR